MAKIETYEHAKELYDFYLENKDRIYHFAQPDDKIVKKIIMGMVADHPEWFNDIIRIDNKIVGGIIGFTARDVLCDFIVAQEVMVYVLPEYRDTKSSIQIVRAWENFEKWAKDAGAKMVRIATYGPYKEYAIRQGYTETTTSFYKELKDE